MRKIKQKRVQLQLRAQENSQAKAALKFEMEKNAKLQNEFPPTTGSMGLINTGHGNLPNLNNNSYLS